MRRLLLSVGPVLVSIALAGALWLHAQRGIPFALRSGDAYEYAEMARRLVAGEGFTTGVIYPVELGFGVHDAHPTVMRPPLWPLMIAPVFAATGPSEPAAHGLLVCLYLAIVALATALAQSRAGPLAGLVTGLALALSPHLRVLAQDGLSETAFAFFVLLAFALFEWRRSAWLVGLACGLAYLVRYNGLVLAPMLGLALMWRAHRGSGRLLSRWAGWRPIILAGLPVGLAFVLVAAPWWLRNYMVAGNPIYSPLNLNLYFSSLTLAPHSSLLYALEPDPSAPGTMAPLAKLARQLPSLLIAWPFLSANLVACVGVLLACVRRDLASWAWLGVALATTGIVAVALPMGRYFVPFLPPLVALGTSALWRHAGLFRLPGLALVLIIAPFPFFPKEPMDLAFARGALVAERARLAAEPGSTEAEARALARLAACLSDRPLVVSERAAWLNWKTGALAIYTPTREEDLERIIERYPVRFLQRRPSPESMASAARLGFHPRPDCAPDLYERLSDTERFHQTEQPE
jgi:hypothetical protein